MIKPKDRQHLDFEVWEKEALKDPKLRAEYDKLQPQFAILRARIEKRLTQKELAQRIGTKQSVSSSLKLSSGN